MLLTECLNANAYPYKQSYAPDVTVSALQHNALNCNN